MVGVALSFPPQRMKGSPREVLLANLPLVERLARSACRGWRMSAEDVEDFVADVKLKLVDRDYAVLRAYEGRCSIATWLAVVIHRQLLDYRVHVAGRFRASAEAQRMGPAAVRLELLLVRDRKPIEEAVEVLGLGGEVMTLSQAEEIVAKLPRRVPRAVPVPLDALEAEPPGPERDAGSASERAAAARTVSDTLRAAIAGLPAQDQTVLQLLFVAGMKVADIARALGLGQQVLYRRIRVLCAQFREQLLSAGIDAGTVRDLLESPEAELELGLDSPSNRDARPSTGAGMPYD